MVHLACSSDDIVPAAEGTVPSENKGAHGFSQHGILQTPYRQQCSPSTCYEAMTFLPAAMKRL